jgi:hypothetical protein
MTDKVTLDYDSVFMGMYTPKETPVPETGINILEDVTLNAIDGTIITIVGSGTTVYKDVPTTVFEANVTGTQLFIFDFPKGTVYYGDRKEYITPKKGEYIFSDENGHHTSNDVIRKMVSKGTIQIRRPVEVSDAPAEVIANISNAAASVADTNILDYMKDNPFFNVAMIVYKVIRDMVVVIIFWALLISISCWVMVKSEYIYPVDPTKFPFVFYEKEKDRFVASYYDYLTPDDEKLCKKKLPGQNDTQLEEQKSFFAEIDRYVGGDNKIKLILRSIYPAIIDHKLEGLNMFSGLLMNLCRKEEEIETAEYIRYIIQLLMFQNFLYCNMVTGTIHGFVSGLSEVFSGLDGRVLVVLFAGVLYSFFSSSSALREGVIEAFAIEFKEAKTISDIISNEFLLLAVNILACCSCIFIPLCGILTVTCLMATAFVLCKNILSPFNTPIWIFCLLTMIFSLGSYLSLTLMAGGVLDPTAMVSFNDASTVTLFIFLFSIVGVGLPIATAIGYAGLISLKVFMSFFNFTGITEVYQRMIRSIPSLVMIALIFLVMHTQAMLGNIYAFMTVVIIFLVGLYILLSKTS